MVGCFRILHYHIPLTALSGLRLFLVRRPQVVLRSCSVPMPPLHGREHPTLSRRRKLGLIPFPAHLPHRCHPVGILDSRPLRGPSSWLSPRRCLARDPAQACAWLLHLEPRHHPLLHTSGNPYILAIAVRSTTLTYTAAPTCPECTHTVAALPLPPPLKPTASCTGCRSRSGAVHDPSRAPHYFDRRDRWARALKLV